MTGFHREPHNMTRVDIATGVAFDEFVAKLEQAAPPLDRAEMERIAAAGGNWDDVRAAVAKNAPNELMVYAKVGGTELLSLAGHRTRAIEYLIGNHVIAETMFRHDQGTVVRAASDAGLQRFRRQCGFHHGPAQRGIRQPRHRRGDRSR